jgi:hypothetical protein
MWALRQSLQGMLVLMLAALTLSACASPAVMQNMVVTPQDIENIAPSPDFKNGITVSQVNSDEIINSLLALKVDKVAFLRALSTSLKQNGLLADQKSLSKFVLFASIASLKQPLLEMDFKVSSNVNYRVVERETKVTWYEELVSASYTAAYSKTGFPVGGLRLANEGAIRENIKEFITKLSKTPPTIVNEVSKTLPVPDALSVIQKLHDLQKALDDGLMKREKYILKRDQILNDL